MALKGYEDFHKNLMEPTKLEKENFEKILKGAMSAVDELWKSGKYEAVTLRCSRLDYSYQRLDDDHVRHPRISEEMKNAADERFIRFILQGDGKDQWGPDATLLLFRVVETFSKDPESISRNPFSPTFTYHYKFEYDWNPDKQTVEMDKSRSGQAIDHGKYQLNQESGKIAAIISPKIEGHYRFPRVSGKKFGI